LNFQPHIIWDWNGTLLDDTEAALATLNIMIAERGGTPIGMPFYLDNFAFPVRPFYDRIGIVAHGEDEWNAIAREYHETYLRQPKALNRGAFAALDMAKAAGCRQSILSALRQDLLDEQTREYGIDGYFERICGSNNLHGASKVVRAREFLAELRASGAGEAFVMIGDAVHDKEVADAIGVPCVLCSVGSHAGWRLREIAPTADTLCGAVETALGLVRQIDCGES
jgi:phosphoglycolate phosphatase-like HAD superfamily hydrolase